MKHWIFAEKLNGRLAMIGLLAAVVNYGFTGWIAPVFSNVRSIFTIIPRCNGGLQRPMSVNTFRL
ncbi:MAG: hypothetical protein CM15mV28_1560 [Thaumasvirus sp.]|nr:MAG: hypothetical protein CM15mV28_1560 [Thaumasvirus sp.]